MVNKKCIDIIKDIEVLFKKTPYPKKDFFQAVADMDYLEISDINPLNKKKKWEEIDLDVLLRYYGFLFFLDQDGQKYYIPAYLTALLKYKEIHDTWIFDTLMDVLRTIDCNVFNFKELELINKSLNCIDTICSQCDKEMLKNVKEKIELCLKR